MPRTRQPQMLDRAVTLAGAWGITDSCSYRWAKENRWDRGNFEGVAQLELLDVRRVEYAIKGSGSNADLTSLNYCWHSCTNVCLFLGAE